MAAAQIATLVGAATLAGVAIAGEAHVPTRTPRTLHLSEFNFDPLDEQPSLPTGWDRSLQTVPDLHLVQFDGPIVGDVPGRLRADGLEVVQYIFPDTYVVWGRGSDRDRVRGQGGVRWTGDFAPAYRVQPQWRERLGELLDVRVLIYRGANVDTVLAALSNIGTALGTPLALRYDPPRGSLGCALQIQNQIVSVLLHSTDFGVDRLADPALNAVRIPDRGDRDVF